MPAKRDSCGGACALWQWGGNCEGQEACADNMKVVVKPLADGGEGTVEALVEG